MVQIEAKIDRNWPKIYKIISLHLPKDPLASATVVNDREQLKLTWQHNFSSHSWYMVSGLSAGEAKIWFIKFQHHLSSGRGDQWPPVATGCSGPHTKQIVLLIKLALQSNCRTIQNHIFFYENHFSAREMFLRNVGLYQRIFGDAHIGSTLIKSEDQLFWLSSLIMKVYHWSKFQVQGTCRS